MVPFIITGILVIIVIAILCFIVNNKIQELQKLQLETDVLIKQIQSGNDEVEELSKHSEILQAQIDEEKKHLDTLRNSIESSTQIVENQKKMSEEAFKNYFAVLEQKYSEAEEEHDMCMDALETSYSNLQLKLMQEMEAEKAELDKVRATRTAAIEAQRKEKEIEEQQSFYCLTIPDNDLKDIAILETIKPKLNNARILSMLIWQTWFRTPMTNLCNNVVGRDVKTGIYKITNQKTKECYVGQAVDIADRWKQHAKCGLGIDTPAANKLYKAMQEYGIWNFSWEVLEECAREQLNEKEKFYIELYQSKEFGYNTVKGVG